MTWTLVGVTTARAAHDSCRPGGHEPQWVGGGHRVFDNVDRAAATAADEPAAVDLADIASGQRSFEEEVETIPLSAGAADADGTVSHVDFYANGILLGSDTTSPFSYTWDDPADGTYVMTATATDDEGATTTSEPRTIERRRNRPPTTSLTAPANGATFTAPATITIDATASDSDGTVARVDFFQGATQIGSDTTSPYSVTWSNVPAGTYSLTPGRPTIAASHDVGGRER